MPFSHTYNLLIKKFIERVFIYLFLNNFKIKQQFFKFSLLFFLQKTIGIKLF